MCGYELSYLLPYKKWRKGQLDIAKAVYESIINKKILLISFPTGAGKTLPVLIGALKFSLNEKYKILYLARTKNQFQAPRRELNAINKKIGGYIKYLTLYNRQDFCLINNLKKLPYEDFLRYCIYLRKNYRCDFYKKLNFFSFSDADLVYKDILYIARENKICPYELIKNISSDLNVIILTYNYIFDPQIREIFTRDFSVDFKKSIFIIDEAHNLPDVLRNILTLELKREWVYNAIREIKKFYMGRDKISIINSLKGLYNYFRSLDKYIVNKNYVAIERESLYDILPSSQSLKKTSIIIETKYEQLAIFKTSYVKKIYDFVDNFYRLPQNILYIERTHGYAVIKSSPIFFGMNVVKPILDSYSTIIMSGTLPPKEYYIALVNLDSIKDRIWELRMPSPLSSNVVIKIIKGITSRYVERSEILYRKIANYIDLIYKKSNDGVILSVFPSYNFMKNVRLYTKTSPIIIEREKSKLIDIISEAKKHRKILLYVVAGGKMVEGIEIKSDGKSIIITVIIAGLPVPEPNILLKNILEIVSLKLRDRDLAWKHIFFSPAIVKILQAIGRSIRSKRDKALVYILDERAKDKYILERLNEYGYRPEIVDDIN